MSFHPWADMDEIRRRVAKYLPYIVVSVGFSASVLLLHNIEINRIMEVDLSQIGKRVFLDRVITQCEPVRSIVYLKTHKTGSSTLHAILSKHKRRFQIENQTRLIAYPFLFFGGYPGHFRKSLAVVSSSNTSKPTPPNYLLGHFRFDEKEVRSLMNPKAKYITIMRHPLKAFESSFYYYYGRHRVTPPLNQTAVTCHPEPYLQIAKKLGVSFPEYIAKSENNINKSIAWYFRSRNYQSFDLGLDPTINDEKYVLDMAKKLNANFDLVLITDHLLESLILLKDILCMEWRDIIPPDKNVGSYEPHTYSAEEERITRNLNNQDLILYNYFNATLWKKVDAYGRKRMEKDVNTLIEYIKKANERKPSPNITQKKRSVQSNNRNKGEKGSKYPANPMELAKAINEKPGYKFLTIDKMNDIAIYMSQNSGWCPQR